MRRHRCHGHRRGFTLVELMVAIVLAAGVLIAGRALFDQMANVQDTLRITAADDDSARVQATRLRDVVRSIETANDSSGPFVGDSHRARFTSWCIGGVVLRARCAIVLSVDSAVVIETPDGTTTVRKDSLPGALRYLGDARNGGRWFNSWGPGITLPLAIGIIFGADTTVLRVGDRG